METITFLIIILVIAFMIVVYQVAKRRSDSAGPSVDPKKPPTPPKKTPKPPKTETRKQKAVTETGALSVTGTAFLDMEMSKSVRRCRSCDAELPAGVMDCPVCGSRGA